MYILAGGGDLDLDLNQFLSSGCGRCSTTIWQVFQRKPKLDEARRLYNFLFISSLSDISDMNLWLFSNLCRDTVLQWSLCIYDELPFTWRSNCFSFYWSRSSRIRWLIVQEGEDTYWACPELKFLLRPNVFSLSLRVCRPRSLWSFVIFAGVTIHPRLKSSLSRSAKVAEKVNCRKRSQFTDLLIL